MRYKLTCSCGKEYPVEISSAGRTLECSCGQTLPIPSMLKMKKLPVWPEEEPKQEAKSAPAETTTAAPAESAVSESTVSKPQQPASADKRFLSGSRLGILIVGIILTLITGFFFTRTVRHTPHPFDVFQKQRDFIMDGNVVRRDSTPIEEDDFNFYFLAVDEENLPFFRAINAEKVTAENLEYCRKFNPDLQIGDPVLFKDIQVGEWANVNEWLIERMTPFMSYSYFEQLKNGPALSDNFYENMDMLKTQYRLRVGLFGVFFLLSLIVCAVPWMLPKQKRVVGTMRGSEWKA